MASDFGSVGHLARRFAGSLSPAGPAIADEQWARRQLLPGERELWGRMSGPDRRHALGVARETIELLGPDPIPREVVAAALLHDVGKVESGLGTFARVAVTIAAMVFGRDRVVAAGRADRQDRSGPRGWRERASAYLAHDLIGADLLSAAGADPLTSTWAGEHHLPRQRWSIDGHLAAALKEADGD